MQNFDLSAFLPYRLSVAAARVSRALARRYQDEFGLSIPEWRVLAHLSGSAGGPISVRDIEARADMEKSRVSRAVARLEAAGYLRKSAGPGDRRLLDLALTEAGQALMARLIPVALGYQADLIRHLGPEAAALIAALDALDGTAAGDLGD